MKVLGLIPARGGSKGVPRKNVREIAGKPLIAWTIEAALAARRLAAIVVSTEDDEIADTARRWGADVPFVRPAQLAADESPGIDPVLHALETLPGFDAVLLLQPTSPLRTAQDIDGILHLASERGAPTAISVRPVADHPAWMYRLSASGALDSFAPDLASRRRQDLEPLVIPNGALYFGRRATLFQQRAFSGPGTLGYAMPASRSLDIDTAEDWHAAEDALARKGD